MAAVTNAPAAVFYNVAMHSTVVLYKMWFTNLIEND